MLIWAVPFGQVGFLCTLIVAFYWTTLVHLVHSKYQNKKSALSHTRFGFTPRHRYGKEQYPVIVAQSLLTSELSLACHDKVNWSSVPRMMIRHALRFSLEALDIDPVSRAGISW